MDNHSMRLTGNILCSIILSFITLKSLTSLGLRVDICAFLSLVLSCVIFFHTLEVDKKNETRLLEEKRIEAKRLIVDIKADKQIYDTYRQKQMASAFRDDDERNFVNETCSKYSSSVQSKYGLLLQYMKLIKHSVSNDFYVNNIDNIGMKLKDIENIL